MNAPVLSVVTPAFNEAATLSEAIRQIRVHLDSLEVTYEVIVVSDGSSDATSEVARDLADDVVRVVAYERNMGKGYALRAGSRVARGEWIAWLDADLDLDPSAIGSFLDLARGEGLDIVVGSKRHPQSVVDYPARRRLYSFGYQMLVRALFGMSVRDTQVGVKLFRRQALDAVLPVLLVKRYAFDLEVLAVARRFGFSAISEGPVTLRYKFSGSGMNWAAIAHALTDTAAIFYRLRFLRFYDRRRRLAHRVTAFGEYRAPTFSVVVDQSETGNGGAIDPSIQAVARSSGAEIVDRVPPHGDAGFLHAALVSTHRDVIAIVDSSARVPDGWLTAAADLLRDPHVAVVVGPMIPRLTGEPARDAATVLTESRFGVGSARVRHQVGALATVSAFPEGNLCIRRSALERALDSGSARTDDLCRVVVAQGSGDVLCSPDLAVEVPSRTRLFAPYLRDLWAHAQRSAADLGPRHRPGLRHLLPLLLVVTILVAPVVLIVWRNTVLTAIILTILALYAVTVLGFLGIVAVVFRRHRGIALRAALGAVGSHLTFGAGLLVGVLRRILPTGAARSGAFGSER